MLDHSKASYQRSMLKCSGFGQGDLKTDRRPGWPEVTIQLAISGFSVPNSFRNDAKYRAAPSFLAYFGSRFLTTTLGPKLSYPEYQALRAERNAFSDLSAYALGSAVFTTVGWSDRVLESYDSGNSTLQPPVTPQD